MHLNYFWGGVLLVGWAGKVTTAFLKAVKCCPVAGPLPAVFVCFCLVDVERPWQGYHGAGSRLALIYLILLQ